MELSATIPALLTRQTASFGSETILRKKDRGIWNAVTWSDLDAHVQEIGQGLLALGFGSGVAAVLLADTRPELVYADLAILGCGGVSVALHADDDAARVREVLLETNAALVVVGGEEQLDKLLSIRAACPALRRIVILDMKGLRDFDDPACISLNAVIEAGTGRTDWNAVTEAVTPDQTAAILVPRTGAGVPVSHAQVMRQITAGGEVLGVHMGDERLAVLPMCDPTERVLGLYLSLKHRIVSNYLENPETATENLREVKPSVFGADTEAWERLHGRVSTMVAGATGVQKALYRWAIGAGAAGGAMGTLANLMVLQAVRGELGFGNLRIAYVGDGALPPEIDQWARALGITVRTVDPFQ